MSNRSSCRVLRTLGMDGFLGFKCGPSCSEKQHNKEIKALIDAIDDLLAYDSNLFGCAVFDRGVLVVIPLCKDLVLQLIRPRVELGLVMSTLNMGG